MSAIDVSEVKDLVEYEKERDAVRSHVIELKKRRRLPLGDNLTLLFENRETVLFQVQEMVRTERIVDPARVQEEIDAYAPLLPGGGELSATLFIEIPELARMSQQEVRRTVNRFQGLDRGALTLELGDHVVPGRFESGHSNEEKMAAVHYVRFAVPPEARAALADGSRPARARVEHPAARAVADLPVELRSELVADLAT
jgi:hypothetical protein